MEKKDITAQTTVRAIITGFVSYGTISVFIMLCLYAVLENLLANFKGSSTTGLYITIPLMAVILLFLVLHLVCKLSTYDVFKKCKTNVDNYKTINKFMNIFFIACIIVVIFIFTQLLNLNLKFQLASIEYSLMQYENVFSEGHITMLHEKMKSQFDASKINLTISTTILSIGTALSFLSLIQYKRKIIKKYNEV